MRRSGQGNPAILRIGHTDLPCFVSDEGIIVQAPLGQLFEAFGEDVAEFIHHMEIGVSTAGGATLSPDGLWSAILAERMGS